MSILKEMWEENPYLTSVVIVFMLMVLLAVATMIFVDGEEETLPDSVLLEVQDMQHIASARVLRAEHDAAMFKSLAEINLLQALLKDRTEQLMMCRELQQ